MNYAKMKTCKNTHTKTTTTTNKELKKMKGATDLDLPYF